MSNAWSLLYDEIYGDDEMSDENESDEESRPKGTLRKALAASNDCN